MSEGQCRQHIIHDLAELPRAAHAIRDTDLDCINGVHDSVLLHEQLAFVHGDIEYEHHLLTAIPAKAPAAMFWRREKLGGSPS